jgi:Domain of unknown function (DUF4062)
MDKRYQVFVSSTYSDLKDERSEIIQTLLAMDCIPAGMELFPAADEEQLDFIKSVIDDCDYYILIIGGRYGSTTPDGVSYTEKEYDYARGQGLRVLSFIHKNPDEIPVGKSEKDPTLLVRLNEFREKVKTGAIVKFWSDAKELAGLVSISLSSTIKAHPAVGWVRANQPAGTQILNELNQALKRNQEFAQRIQELQDEIDAFKPAVENLADLADSFVLSGLYKFQGRSTPEKLTVTWGQLFAAIAPHILGKPNDARMYGHFETETQALFKARNPNVGGLWFVGAQDFATVKIQLSALNLVTVSMQQTSDNKMALFWSLTPLGEQTLISLRTVKKSAPNKGSGDKGSGDTGSGDRRA